MTGLRELQRACAASERELRLGVRAKLREAAEPVKVEAERLGPQEISNLGPTWGRMRVGVTTSLVYVAPASRRRGGSPRPNLSGLLMNRVLQPALERERPRVERALETLIDEIADRNW